MIRGKILLCTAVITLTIVGSVITICYHFFQSFLRKNQIQSAEYNLQVVSNNAAASLENILNFCERCRINQDISHYLEAFNGLTKMPPISSDDAYLRAVALNTYERLKEEYHNTPSFGYISRVVISPHNRCNYLQVLGPTSSNIVSTPDVIYSSDYFEELITHKDYGWIGLVHDPMLPGQSTYVIPICRPILHQLNSQSLGWIYLSISDRLLLDYLDAFPLEEDSALYLTIGTASYQYQDGTFRECKPSIRVQKDISDLCFNSETCACYAALENGSRRAVITGPFGRTGWTISQVLSETAYQEQNKVYLSIILAIAGGITFIGLMLYALLDKIINLPLQLLQYRISQISLGDFSQDPSIEWEDELGTIGKGINRMSKAVSILMNKRVEDEKQKKDLEYQILQSQINPHFLYNTLNSIKWMATIQRADGIAEMTTALARLLKSVSKGTSARITLRGELL